MTPLQAIAVAVRLVAIWLGLMLFTTLPMAWSYVHGAAWGLGPALTAAGGVLGTAAIALFFWLFPTVVAKKLLPGPMAEHRETGTSPEQWFVVGTRLMGVWILSRVLPTLILQIIYRYMAQEPGAERVVQPPTGWDVFVLVLQLLMGLLLLFGAQGLLGLLRLARSTEQRATVNQSGDPT